MSLTTKRIYTEKEMCYVQDTLYVLSGKWKLLIIFSLCNGNNRFMEIHKKIPRITTRMLSKELKDLEANKLIKRIIHDEYPLWIEYKPTTYCLSMQPIIEEMIKWGKQHRIKIKEK
ncbi:MAG: helix-turn-helix transcriptional regulator [Chitinophaga sp.]|uniref:winged helix-turn-helix transcriptional regulator n=1 Tax=Chitinophaga sp. TaxID=1869181 RepID=UPI001AFD7BC6|nr:helix-turn-helix transcriptional regulator [Chitinophaga sp.]